MVSPLAARLPRVLVASAGVDTADLPAPLSGAVFARDLDLVTLISLAASPRPPIAVDIDAIQGLNPDAAAVRFVLDELAIRVVATHRPAIAAAVADRGGLALLHVFAFDSTGLARVLEARPHAAVVGTLVSPGPVLAHLLPADLERLPRPIVAYGLVATEALARTLLLRADAVILSPRLALEVLDAATEWAPTEEAPAGPPDLDSLLTSDPRVG